MTSSNVQVRLDSRTLKEIEALTSESRSAFVREAIIEKIKKEKSRKLEKQWIKALAQNSSQDDHAQDWLNSEAWEEK